MTHRPHFSGGRPVSNARGGVKRQGTRDWKVQGKLLRCWRTIVGELPHGQIRGMDTRLPEETHERNQARSHHLIGEVTGHSDDWSATSHRPLSGSRLTPPFGGRA